MFFAHIAKEIVQVTIPVTVIPDFWHGSWIFLNCTVVGVSKIIVQKKYGPGRGNQRSGVRTLILDLALPLFLPVTVGKRILALFHVSVARTQ